MNGDPNGRSLFDDRPSNFLSDPPGGIGREAASLRGIEFFCCPDQPQISLLDQIEKKKSVPHIAPGETRHQTKIGQDQMLPKRLDFPQPSAKISSNRRRGSLRVLLKAV